MPRATSELRRGLNAYNLRVGALSAAAIGVVMLAATATGTVPRHGPLPPKRSGRPGQAVAPLDTLAGS